MGALATQRPPTLVSALFERSVRSPQFRRVARIAFWALIVLLFAQAVRLVSQPDAQAVQRQANRDFVQGRYHAALQSYAQLSVDPGNPQAALHLGIVRWLRGEYVPAERALRQALQRGLADDQRQLALLYLGQVLTERGRVANATHTWGLLPVCVEQRRCPYAGPKLVLEAEQALLRGNYADAVAGYAAALEQPLAPPWYKLAGYRLALLQAADDTEVATATIARVQSQQPRARTEPFLTPLLPQPAYSLDQFRAVLNTNPAERAQALGQFYLDLNLYGLAEAQFAAVAADSPEALAAATYAAYTRWRAGDTAGGLTRLEALVAAHPDETRARTLLALAYVAEQDPAAARLQIEALTQRNPKNPDAHLAWANWYAAQRDYVAASEQYRQALTRAAPADRGRYALLAANFYLETAYEMCSAGLPAAELAARQLPDDAAAWTTLAAHRYQCGEFSAAKEAAQTALALGANAGAAFYLGAALAELGNAANARRELIRAADLAPASVWRERAEATLARMPEPSQLTR